MVKNLDHDWELEGPTNYYIHHFWDTIRALGGWKGILILFIGLAGFYLFVVYTIENGRIKREKAKFSKRN